jgi:hypothetical protein
MFTVEFAGSMVALCMASFALMVLAATQEQVVGH